MGAEASKAAMNMMGAVPTVNALGTATTPATTGTLSKEELLQSDKADLVRETVASDCVVIFSKTSCAYCRIIKRTFNELNVIPTVMELNKREDGAQIQEVLGAMTGAKTVPRVFINGQFVGGCAEVKELHKSGKLPELIQECK